MTPDGTIPVGWTAREPPLVPTAVYARGATALALAELCLEREVGGLRGVAGPDLIVLVGPPEGLPWVDGCAYLGRDPDAPGLLLPTTVRPDAPLPLYARAVLAKAPDAGAPIAVVRGSGSPPYDPSPRPGGTGRAFAHVASPAVAGAAPLSAAGGPSASQGGPLLVPLGGARPLDRGVLRAWLERARLTTPNAARPRPARVAR